MTIQYVDDGDVAIFDNLSFRRDKRTGYFLNAKTHKRLHVYVWEYYNGSIPNGYHIHHKDFDKNNNELDNLMLISASEHSKLHSKMWSDERYEKQTQILKEKAIPKATEWHKSEDGREWHKQHYEQMKDKWYKIDDFVCLNCGNTFTAVISRQNKFCSNKCKSAYRRKSGVDNETRICEICGRKFTTNKYSTKRTCSEECKYKLRKNKKNMQDRKE